MKTEGLLFLGCGSSSARTSCTGTSRTTRPGPPRSRSASGSRCSRAQIRPVIPAASGGASHDAVVSCCLSANGIRFLGILLPPEASAPSRRSVYGLVFCVRTSAWMMSLTSQMLTFMPASTHPLRSQNAMNSRASASPGRPPHGGRRTRGGRRIPCSGRTGRNRALVIGDVLAEYRLRRGPRLMQRAPPAWHAQTDPGW